MAAFKAVLLPCRFALFPETIRPLLQHPVQSMFIGTIPMALTTIVNGLPVFLLRYWCAAEPLLRCWVRWAGAAMVLQVCGGMALRVMVCCMVIFSSSAMHAALARHMAGMPMLSTTPLWSCGASTPRCPRCPRWECLF